MLGIVENLLKDGMTLLHCKKHSNLFHIPTNSPWSNHQAQLPILVWRPRTWLLNKMSTRKAKAMILLDLHCLARKDVRGGTERDPVYQACKIWSLKEVGPGMPPFCVLD
jgi:hypothetical protein